MTSEFGRSVPQVEGLNELARTALLDLEAQATTKLLEFNHEALTVFMNIDLQTIEALEANNYAPGTEVEIYVPKTNLVAPFADGHTHPTRSLLLFPNRYFGNEGMQQIALHTPVPDPEPPIEDMPKSTVMYVERMSEGHRAYYKVDLDEPEPYLNLAIEGSDELVLPPKLEEHELETRDFSLRVVTHLPFLSKLWQDIVNMVVVPQVRFRVPEIPKPQ